jgi:DNA-binding transcriptional ArsR family regulator
LRIADCGLRYVTFNRMVERSAPHLDDVFSAVADPTRRAILDTLARGEVTVGELAARFPISLNGVSKHVRVLERAGLVARDVQGREHRLTFDARPREEATAWMARYSALWDARLDAFERLLRPRGRSRRRTRCPTRT